MLRRSPRVGLGLASVVLLLSACARNITDARLVGTWELAWDLQYAAQIEKSGSKQSTDEVLRALRSEIEARGVTIPSETFEPDGTLVMHGPTSANSKPEKYRWSVVETHPDRVTIEVRDARASETCRRTFVFEQPDLIREEGGKLAGTRSRRVKHPA